ncbi:gp436 family protein [Catenovulum sediminis]|uniref:gp436 family protein n=1 Tax=Catenovulum sediminis TaxID=1740262 RepID=UPI00117D7FC1|nr:DUF1320 domain-containing protein [Catenovulum sediminis]
MYATLVDMVARFGEDELILLAQRDDSSVEFDEVVNQALQDATAEINGYIAGRYTLPLAQTPEVLKRNCCDIARYLLSDDRAPEQVEKRYQATIQFLRSVGKGELSLGLSNNQPSENVGTVAVIMSDGHTFSRQKSKGFI